MPAHRSIPARPARPAFTLVECVCAITVIAVTAAVVLPVISSSTTAYANATAARDVSEDVAYAMDRCLAMLRDTPPAATAGSLALSSASASGVTFSDGRALSYASGVLSLTDATGASAPLLRGMESFSLGCFAQNGTTSTMATPASTWIFTVRLRKSGFELRGAAFVRARSLGS